MKGALNQSIEAAAAGVASVAKVLWLGSSLPRLLTTPNGSQWLPTTPDSLLRLQTRCLWLPLTPIDSQLLPPRELTPLPLPQGHHRRHDQRGGR